MASSECAMKGYIVVQSNKGSLPGKYFCSLCGKILREPLQTNCGHFYCKSCYRSNQEADGSFVCLLDEVSLMPTEVYPDTFMKREILSLILSCPTGCSWSGEIRDMEAHLSKCPLSTVQCPNTRCTVAIKRSELPHHLEEECSFRRKPCSYCKKMIVGYDMDEHHLQFCEGFPVRCPGCKMEGIKRGEIKRHRDPIYGDCEATQMDCAFEAVGCKVEKSQHVTLRRNQEPTVDEVGEIRQRQAAIERQLCDLRAQMDCGGYDGVLVWSIPSFAEARANAVAERETSFDSPFFYTSRHGYKLCVRIYLNGDGMGKGTHITVFFVIMRGQFDAILRWPFRQNVTITLLDQDHVEHVISTVRPDPNHPSFQRPQTEMNIASGCPLFFPLEKLNEHGYVRDDTMFIKVNVDSSDL